MSEPFLVEILACPRCDERPPLELIGDSFRCDLCGASFPIVNGIVDFLASDTDPSEVTQDAH